MNIQEMTYQDFPHQTYDKLRYRDTDANGHVNNAVFATFLETGRTEILLVENDDLFDENCTLVIVNSNINFIAEANWPGVVKIGTCITKMGSSSMKLYQRFFQDERLVGDAVTTIVQISEITRKSSPFTEASKAKLIKYLIQED